MSEDLLRQSIIDQEHLKLLSLGYMISAAMTAFSSLFGLWFIFVGTMVSFTNAGTQRVPSKPSQPSPAFFGWIFGGIGVAVFLILLALAALKLKAAFCIKRRESRTFCMVIAAITCVGFPYGTALGVLTLMVLGRDSVVRLFTSPAGRVGLTP